MNIYSIVLFLHVSGDIGLFIGISVQLLSLMTLRRAKHIEQVRAIIGLITLSEPLSIASALLTIVTGLYMALTVWGWEIGWTTVTLISLIVFLPPLIRGIIEPRMHAIVALANDTSDGPLPVSLEIRIHDPILGTALQTLAAVVLGIVFLMTTKPAFAGAITVMIVAMMLGLASGLLLRRTSHMKKR